MSFIIFEILICFQRYLEFNFDSIEDTLGSLILPKIKRFNNSENCLRTVIYQYEGFRGTKKNIIIDYIEKYEQRKLKEEETYILVDFISKEQIKENFNIKNFLFSIQILIDIILNNNYEKNEKLSKIIMKIEDNPNISILKKFFNTIKKEVIDKNSFFTVDCLIDFMNFIENLSWEKIRNDLNKVYLIDLSDNIKAHIDKIYSNNNEKELTCSKQLLCTAIRRFISRYLLWKKEENEINSNYNLYNYLDKVELWSIGNTKNIKIKEELKKIIIINETNYISVGQAKKLFDYLGGDLYSFEKMVRNMKEKEKNKEIEKEKIIEIDKNKEENDNDNIGLIGNKNNKEDCVEKLFNKIKPEEENEEEEEEQSLDEDEEFNY